MKRAGWIIGIIVAALIGFFVRGLMPSGGPPPGMGGMQMPPVAVNVFEVRETALAAADEYIAIVEPLQEVMIKTEVSGYIDEVHFKEGAMVREGDLLFTIDQKQYQAMVEVREAELARAEAELKRSKQFLDRMREASARSISQSDLDTAESNHLQAVAAYKQAEANLNMARIDLAYAEIRAPINGRIGAAMLTKGNYVDSMSGSTLARIVQIDPIRVVFSQTDRDYLAMRRRELAGNSSALEARVVLPDETPLPNRGEKDFDDNAIDPSTGTIAVRYLFDNPEGLLVPGGYVKAHLSNPDGMKGIKIPQRALLLDKDGAYVLTVNESGTVGIARVEAGEQIGQDIVIHAGLIPGDRVVVDGVQKAQPGATVQVVPAEG